MERTPSSEKPTVIAVVGPTASGKTSLSIELALRFGGEVIACDSRTVYRYMDIGTAKPDAVEQKGVRHHLLDVVEPDKTYTVAEYQVDGRAALDSIFSRGKLPIVCGGTGLYSRALLEGLSIPEVAPQEQLRQTLKEQADNEGNSSIYRQLQQVDPAAAEKIMPNDRFRIIRALEVTLTLGRPFSEVTRRVEVPFNVIWIGLNFDDRNVLKDRIRDRFEVQMKAGLLEESKYLYERFGETQPIMNAVTYRQMINHIKGIWTLDEAFEDGLKHNYQLARKQMMWFRANPDTQWIIVDKSKDLFDEALSKIDSIYKPA